jgi:septin family protein
MLAMLRLKRVSRSSPLLSVGLTSFVLNNPATRNPLTTCTELELDEEGTRISLTIVDTPGFGDEIDNEAR